MICGVFLIVRSVFSLIDLYLFVVYLSCLSCTWILCCESKLIVVYLVVSFVSSWMYNILKKAVLRNKFNHVLCISIYIYTSYFIVFLFK